MELITSADFLGNQPKTYLFKKNQYKTSFGGFLSILTALAITSSSLYFITIAFTRQQINLLSSQTTKFDKKLDLTKIPFLFFPANTAGSPNTSVIYPVFQFWAYPPKSKGVVNITNIPFKQCDNSDLNGYEDLFVDFSNLNSYYCMNKSGLNLTIYGDYGDIVNGYSKLQVYIAKCRNGSIYNPNPNRQGCLPQDKIDSIISSVPLQIYTTFPDYEIDFQNSTNPYLSYLRTESFLISSQAMNTYAYFLKLSFINSDFGFVFEETEKLSSYQADTMQSVTLLGSNYYVSEGYGCIIFALSSKADMHYRSYFKLQSLVANVGGVINFIYLLAKLIISYISNKSLLLEFVNHRCDYKSEDVLRPDIEHSNINLRHSVDNTSSPDKILKTNVIPFKMQQR
jgi:hypothetical protein